MAQILTPSLSVTLSTKVRKIRELPVPGKIDVQLGSVVKATDIVATAERLGELEILRIPEKLGIEPIEVQRGLKVAVGETMQPGQLVCEHAGFFGLFKSRLHSPVAGVVEFIAERTGHVGIRLAPKKLELSAYIAGTVVDIGASKSVTIESNAALVQGIFGVGGERQGRIKLLIVDPSAVVRVEHIPSDCKGLVLVGGMRPSIEALQCAKERGAVGFVTGSIDDRTLARYLGFDVGVAVTGDEDVSMSVIITEGFGEIAISERVISLLQGLNGRWCSINGATQVRAGAVRPEIVVPHDAGTALQVTELAGQGLTVDRIVRLIRYPYFGMKGKVTELPHAPEQIETGAFTRVLRAKLEDGRTVTVPRANVELV